MPTPEGTAPPPGRRPSLAAASCLAAAALAAAALAAAVRWAAGTPTVAGAASQELGAVVLRHPLLAGASALAGAAALALLAAGLASGSPAARRAGALAFLSAAAVGLAAARHSRWLPLAVPAAAALAALAAGLLRARSHPWFDGRAFAASRPGRAWAVALARLRALGAALPAPAVPAALLAAGVAARVASLWTMDLWIDGQGYAAMGHAWMRDRSFLLPWGDVASVGPGVPGHSHHFPPLYPAYLGVFYTAFGYGLAQTKAASLLAALLCLAVAYACTRDLYGPRPALWVAALLSVDPTLVWSTGSNFSESLALMLFALTLWGIVKSLDHPPAILVAGAAAGLAYLTRSSMGPFFVVAGVGGLLWRFVFLRWRVFTNPWYLAAIAVFLSMFGAWAWRNVRLFGGWPAWDAPWSRAGGPLESLAHLAGDGRALAEGAFLALFLAGLLWIGRPRLPAARVGRGPYAALGAAAVLAAVLAWAWLARNRALHGDPPWETSAYVAYGMARAADDPGLLARIAAHKALFVAALLAFQAVPFLPEVRASLRRIRQEHESALWLAVALIALITLAMVSVFRTFEASRPMFWFDNRRYLLAAVLPLLWLTVRGQDTDRPGLRLRLAAVGAVLLVLTVATCLVPVRYSAHDAARALGPELEAGTTIDVEGSGGKYTFYSYLPRHDVAVAFRDLPPAGTPCDDPAWPDYIVAIDRPLRPQPCHALQDTYARSHWDGRVDLTQVWAKA